MIYAIKTISFVIPMIPPSINEVYIPINRRGSKFGTKVMSDKAKRFKEVVSFIARREMSDGNHKLIEGPFSLLIDYYMVNSKHEREKDVTNCDKALIDALKGIVFKDDRTLGRNILGSDLELAGIYFSAKFSKFITEKDSLTQVQIMYPVLKIEPQKKETEKKKNGK